jgi:RNA polymerase sigma-70 factor (family 1)
MDKLDELTVQHIRIGDTETFRKLFKVYYRRLFLYAKSYVGDPGDAEDIVQDLFYHLWENRKEINIYTSLTSYFFRAIHNRCIQFLRHKKVVEGYESQHLLKIKEAEILCNSSSDFTFTELQFEEIQNIFSRTNNTLPDKTREIFKLSREDSMSNKEIASLLKLQVKTIEYHITKALKTFHGAMKDYFVLLLFI